MSFLWANGTELFYLNRPLGIFGLERGLWFRYLITKRYLRRSLRVNRKIVLYHTFGFLGWFLFNLMCK